MSCLDVPIQTILGTECIGDSLPKIMGNFNTLGDATCDLITKVNTLSTNIGSLSASGSASITSLSSTVDTKFIPKPTSASAQQVLTYDGSTTTWVASAASVGGGISFATRTQLLNSTGNNTVGTFTGSINLASFPAYATANMVQLYIYMLSQSGNQPTTFGQNFISLSAGTDSYGTVLYHSNDSAGSAWFSDNNSILIDTRTSKTINYSVTINPASCNVTYAIFAIGKN